MIKFDKMKIVSSIENISDINEDKFDVVIKDGLIHELKFSIQSPYSLYIEIDYIEKELVLEFTGKILKDDYPNLINKDTIRTCLSNINDFGVCSLNIDKILSDGYIVKADVCQDVTYPNYKELTKSLRANVSNYKKYLVSEKGSNLIIEKNVQTKGYKCRLTIYNKEQELQRACNRQFLQQVEDKSKLLASFKDKLRFEMNLNSMEQLRKSLNITDTSIYSVMNSNSTPIWNFLDKTIQDSGIEAVCTNLSELKNQLLLEYCGCDLAKVEALLRNYHSPNTHISQVMRPYRALAEKMTENLTPSVKQQLRNLLLEVFVFGIISLGCIQI